MFDIPNKDFNSIMSLVYHVRGLFINEFIVLERNIDLYLARTFGKPNLINALHDWVFTDRIFFENKIQIFKLTIERCNPEFKSNNPQYFNDLLFLVQQRNIFAHYAFINDDASLKKFVKDKTLTFAKFKNDAEVFEYTQDKINKVCDLLLKYAPVITDLVNSVSDEK